MARLHGRRSWTLPSLDPPFRTDWIYIGYIRCRYSCAFTDIYKDLLPQKTYHTAPKPTPLKNKPPKFLYKGTVNPFPTRRHQGDALPTFNRGASTWAPSSDFTIIWPLHFMGGASGVAGAAAAPCALCSAPVAPQSSWEKIIRARSTLPVHCRSVKFM